LCFPAATRPPICGFVRRAVLEPDDQLQAGPRFVDRAYLHIHQPALEGYAPHHVFGEIGRNAGGSLGPGNPKHAVRFHDPRQRGKIILENGQLVGEKDHDVGFTGNPVAVRHAFRKPAQIAQEARWMIAQHQPMSGLDADLLRQRCS
jgi:hypothetical protein